MTFSSPEEQDLLHALRPAPGRPTPRHHPEHERGEEEERKDAKTKLEKGQTGPSNLRGGEWRAALPRLRHR